MIEEAEKRWRDFCTALARFSTHLDRNKAVNVNSAALRDHAKQVAQQYFRHVRQDLLQFQLDELIEPLSIEFEALIVLSEGRNAAASYRRHAKAIRKLIPRVTSQLAVHDGTAATTVSSSEPDGKIVETLAKLVPSAALSYQQALRDLSDTQRQSFRGPAHELREALREVLDHFAPDADVMAVPGFKLEKDRPKPTMKQKVRFILKARSQNDTERAVPESAVSTVEALIADMTRSTYDRGSLAAHTERGKKDLEQLKRYVDVVLHDLLVL